MIEFKGTGFTYDGERFVLDGVDARIERGEFVCVLGGNGSGKSTLAKHVNALLVPDEGSVTVLDRDTRDERSTYHPATPAWCSEPRRPSWWQALSSKQRRGLSARGTRACPPTSFLARGRRAGRRGTAGFRTSATTALSAAEAIAAIAGVLAMEPAILILDEATGYAGPARAIKGHARVPRAA